MGYSAFKTDAVRWTDHHRHRIRLGLHTQSVAEAGDLGLQRTALQSARADLPALYTGMDAAKYIETLKPQALKRTETRLVLEAIVKAEDITISEEEFEKEASDMAKAYQMEVDKFKELISEREKEQIMMDMAVQKAVTLITEAAIEE